MPKFHVSQVYYGTGSGEQISRSLSMPVELPQPGTNGKQLWVFGGTAKLATTGSAGAITAQIDISDGATNVPTQTMKVWSNFPPDHCTFRPLYVETSLPAGTANVTIQGADAASQWDSNDTIQVIMIELDS